VKSRFQPPSRSGAGGRSLELTRVLVPRSDRGVLVPIVLGWAVLVLVVWFSDRSPAAIARTDAMVAQDREAAAETYDHIAEVSPFAKARHQALLRSAAIYATDLQNPFAAVDRLEQASASAADHVERAEILSRIGRLYQDALDKPDHAADAFLAAYQAAPEAVGASEWLVSAARARELTDDLDTAELLWAKVGQNYPERAGQAMVAQGRILLAHGKTNAALRQFEAAAATTRDPVLAQVAHLGAATALERRGDLSEALVEVEAAGLPDDVYDARVGALQGRLDDE